MTADQPPDLPTFLLARIEEDQRYAELGVLPEAGRTVGQCTALTATQSARVLAECESKRRIVEDFTDSQAQVDGGDRDYLPRRNVLWSVLQFLALPYADHDDYREEWKP